jgi:hypothetical protein
MITSNVIGRVFHVKYKDALATAFLIDVDDRQYFVTAKHVIENSKSGDTISIHFNEKWVDTQFDLVGHSEVDISVFCISHHIPCHPMPAESSGICYGQDLYFLGFPLGLKGDSMGKINRMFPVPLVKKGILSGLFNDNTGN